MRSAEASPSSSSLHEQESTQSGALQSLHNGRPIVPAKKAFIVGINSYKNRNFDLKGCLNDVDSLIDTLVTKKGFTRADIIVLKDAQATKTAILSGIRQLFGNIGEGDVLVFGYAGHGTEFSKPGDDNVFEALVPYETETTASLLSNREINAIARQAIQVGNLTGRINFTAIYDCCHSGKMYRELMLNEDGKLVFDDGIQNRLLDLSLLLPDNPTRDIELNDFQVFSACHHEETAADMAPKPALGLDKPRGAFSFALHELIRANPACSVNDLENHLPEAVAKLVKPHIQRPVFAVQADWKSRPILTV